MKRKTGWRCVLAFAVSVVMVVSMFFGIGYPGNINGTASIATVEAAGTIKVTKADGTTAGKIHKQLYKGRGITLRVKGNSSASKKLVKKLETKIQKENKQGVVFRYQRGRTKGNYTYYTVSSDDAKLYMYSVKFVDKMFKSAKKKYQDEKINKTFYQDYLKNKNEESRMLHTAYDFYTTYLVSTNVKYAGGASCTNSKIFRAAEEADAATGIKYTGISKKTTAGGKVLADEYALPMENQKVYEKLVKSVSVKDNLLWVQVMSYAEFSADKDIKKIYTDEKTWCSMYYKVYEGGSGYEGSSVYKKGYSHLFMRNRDAILYGTKNFCNLSPAMKVYALADSEYFQGELTKKDGAYDMIYDYQVHDAPSNQAQAMKTLYQNKAKGVCQAFAQYEQLVFDQLNITNYFNSNHNINHAWTVVKVKNSKGKTLWIPFDYGIGPADSRWGERLGVSESVRKKYLSTEKKQYKLYLANISGAPTKKNFKNTDFN